MFIFEVCREIGPYPNCVASLNKEVHVYYIENTTIENMVTRHLTSLLLAVSTIIK